ncbi:hypothetical protein Glove_421g126 [Diversispora epigaea]|uniref:Uncharacterized protein n=1 Tax=Diversispora epigaea TaxID=1348612 RepID=A0A397GXF3_9GLOM|nr:hypothetical protein Glove_421g126 [Diversispora epigaea]
MASYALESYNETPWTNTESKNGRGQINNENEYIYGWTLQKISKFIFVKPNQMTARHTKPNKTWKTPIIEKKGNDTM